MAVTLRDIAERAGVSIPTVSTVLNGKGQRYSEATRQRILSAAKDVDYRPNASARAMRKQSFGAAGLLFRELQNFLPIELLRGLVLALAARDMHLVVDQMPLDRIDQGETYSPQILRQLCVDGLIVHYARLVTGALQRLIRDHGIPAVWINQIEPEDCVCPDDRAALYDLTRLALAAGHRRIAFLSFHPRQTPVECQTSREQARMDGYRSAMVEAGLEPRVLHEPLSNEQLYGDVDDSSRIAFCRTLLGDPDRPSLVLTRSPQEAGPLLGIAAGLGFDDPGHFDVATVHERIYVEGGRPIPTLIQPMRAVAETAVGMLAKKIAGTPALPSVMIPFGAAQGPRFRAPQVG